LVALQKWAVQDWKIGGRMAEENISARPKVLVVEDEAVVRMDLAAALSVAGFDVIEVANADDAIAVLSASPEIAALITDMELFGSVDGIQLAWMVRNKWPPTHIFVVSGRHRIAELELPERSQFFSKPYRTDQLISELRRLLAKSKNQDGPPMHSS
jgi:two-component system, response regulator PdtaR